MIEAVVSRIDAIQPWRDRYRQEMPRQILHDSIHYRAGWIVGQRERGKG